MNNLRNINKSAISLPHLGEVWRGYHPDHLGSSSWITNTQGVAIQHLQYLPFGELRVNQRSTTWNSRYTFSAKEKDEESDYGYFGARYYSSDLSIWISVDPLAHALPHQSPYVYCSNNPIILVDPTGMLDELFINGNEADAATAQLQKSTSLTLSRDDKTGKISATGTAKTPEDQQLLDAINSKDVKINVKAEDSEWASSGHPHNGGAFMGTTINSDGTVTANQEVNPLKTGAIDMLARGTITGETMMHEVTEAFEAGKISKQENKNLLSAIPGNATYKLYDTAHKAATPQPDSPNVNRTSVTNLANTFRSIGQMMKNAHKPNGR